MAAITAAAVKELRDRTGAGMMECKKALGEAEGDLDRAIAVLRERGLAKADKRAGRETTEGAIAMAVEAGHGALVELGCETDFVARTDEFQSLAGALASAASADANAASPETLEQAKAGDQSVSQRLQNAASTLGENIVIKRVQRLEVNPGLVGGYVHAGGKLGVLVAVRTEANGDGLKEATRDLAMHVAAADPSPLAIDRGGVDPAIVAGERELFEKQARQSGKPEKVIDKIVEGRLNKFFSEICLLEQSFVKDPDQSVGKMLEAAGKSAGGEIAVTEYIRYRLGESTDS